MRSESPTRGWRRASGADAGALRDLEREANLIGLAHVFPGDQFPFPDDGVLARWAIVLDDPDVVTEVVDGDQGLLALAAYDLESLRHLAVHPDAWGSGLATAGIQRAVRHGAGRLWVLVDNHRARRLYEHLGWRPTGVQQDCPWAPHPLELEYALVGSSV